MAAILIAVVLDLIFKDPPNRLHPTAWMGSMISLLRGKHTPANPAHAFLKGMMIPLVTASLFGAAAWGIIYLARLAGAPGYLLTVITGFLLYFTITFTRLLQVGGEIGSELSSGDLKAARKSLSYHLVSRETSALSGSEVCAATLESLSENLTDGLSAPLLMFMLFGLPGAVVYRVFNTCDAMLGYRTEELEWLGKFSARVDDLLNYIPARITALFILLAGIVQVGPHRGLHVMLGDHRKTESPNAGWTMAALAGVLGVRLEKVGCYVLNPAGKNPETALLVQGISICRKGGYLFIIGMVILLQGAGFGLPL